MSTDDDDERQLAERRSALPPEQILHEILQVEQQRIDRDNRRTAVMETTLDIADKQDQRQFEFATASRDGDMALKQDKLRLVRNLVWALLALASVTVLSLLGFVFFGSETQRAAATALVTPAVIGIAGYGVITTLISAVKALNNR